MLKLVVLIIWLVICLSGLIIGVFAPHSLYCTPGKATVVSVAFNTSGCHDRTLAWVNRYDGESEAWILEADQPQVVHHFAGHIGDVMSVAFAPDGLSVVTGSADGTAKLWDTSTGRLIGTLQVNSTVNSVAFARNGLNIITGSASGTALLWDTRTGRMIRPLCPRLLSPIWSWVAFGVIGLAMIGGLFWLYKPRHGS